MKWSINVDKIEQNIQGVIVSGHIDSETWCFVLRIKHSNQVFDYKMTKIQIEDSKALGLDIIEDIINKNIKLLRKNKLEKLKKLNEYNT